MVEVDNERKGFNTASQKKGSLWKGIVPAVLAAALYALNAPFSKLLLADLPPTLMAGLLYVGAGIGMAVLSVFRRAAGSKHQEEKLTRSELPWTVAMIVLDIAAPVLLMWGLTMTSAASASLLNNFEIVATALFAAVFFREKISPRLWAGIAAVTLACALLSFQGADSLQFSRGSLLVLGAASLWGLENNCTRRLSSKDPLEIVLLKGIFSGSGSLLIGYLVGERVTDWSAVVPALLVGFVAYGLSIYVYVYAQRMIGAARTSAYYAIAPFLSSFLSLLIFREVPGRSFLLALAVMAIGAILCASDEPLTESWRRMKKRRSAGGAGLSDDVD